MAGYGLAAITVVFLARHVGLHGRDFVEAGENIPAQAMLLSGLSFGLHLAINACAFAFLGRALDMRVSQPVLASAWGGSLLAKYVPGGIWQIAGRGVLLGRFGIGARAVVVSGVIEQALSIAICAAVAAIALWWTKVAAGWWVGFTSAGIAALGVTPYLIRRVAGIHVDRRRFAQAASLYAIAMAPYALGYIVIVSPSAVLEFLGALFGGTVAGVLALPVPGGLGVREAATSVLSESTEPDLLLAALLACRAIILLMELLVSAISIGALRRLTPP